MSRPPPSSYLTFLACVDDMNHRLSRAEHTPHTVESRGATLLQLLHGAYEMVLLTTSQVC